MTICISAIGKDSKTGKDFIVFSTDHMVTFGSGSGNDNEFEHNIKKYKILGLTKKSVAMLSGKTLLFERLLEGTKNLDDYDDIRNKVHENFRNIKKDEIKKQLLEPFSLVENDLKDFLLKPAENPVSRAILESIMKHNLGTSILLIGFKEGKAQIYELNEFSNLSVKDIHFHTIGSGAIQASNTLFIQKHSNDNGLQETIYNVYKAKRNAEVAIGVGQDTEVLVCVEDKIIPLDQEDLEKLKKIYEEERTFGAKKILAETLNSISSLI